MVSLYVVSNDPYSGKTLTCIVLGTRWQRAGRKVGYIKPLGLLPVTVENQITDEDAQFAAHQLNLQAAPSQLCPILLRPETCTIEPQTARSAVKEAFNACAAGKDIMLINGMGAVLSRGILLGLDGPTVAELLDAKVLLIGRCQSYLHMDSIVAAYRALKDRFVGVILNRVPPRRIERIQKEVVPCLESQGITVLGLMPDDPVLHSVTVQELAEATGGEFLTGHERAEELVENFVVGAMGANVALHYFRQTTRKCVITGGDRSDIQLAALETPTRCLLLTGNLRPRHTVLARAEELSVPVLLVKDDTLTTVATIERLLGKLRVREPKKIEHALKQFELHVDLTKLDSALGL